VENVIAKLVGLIGRETYEAYADRFIFAVAVHSIECWLLPLVFDDHKTAKITGCLDVLNHELRAVRNVAPLSLADGKGKDPQVYARHAREYKKPKQLQKCSTKNRSLALFLNQFGRLLSPKQAEID